jgi:hypothetical protein
MDINNRYIFSVIQSIIMTHYFIIIIPSFPIVFSIVVTNKKILSVYI